MIQWKWQQPQLNIRPERELESRTATFMFLQDTPALCLSWSVKSLASLLSKSHSIQHGYMTHEVKLIVEVSAWHPPLFHKGLKNAMGINVRWSHSQYPCEKDNFLLGPKPCIWRPLRRAEWKATVPDSWSLTMVLHTVLLAAVLPTMVWSLPIYRAPTNQGVGTLQKKAAKKQYRQALWSTKHFKWAPDVCI